MVEGTIEQVFYTIEMKLKSYEVIAEKGAEYSPLHRSWLFRDVDFNYVEAALPLLDKNALHEHIKMLIEKANNLLTNSEYLNRISTILFDALDGFEDFSICRDEIINDISKIISRLKYYLSLEKNLKLDTKNQFDTNDSKRTNASKQVFKKSLSKELLYFHLDDKQLFESEDIDEDILSENIDSFILGNFNKIKGKLNFSVREVRIGYYIINSILKQGNISPSKVKNVTINGNNFHWNGCRTAVSKLKKERELVTFSGYSLNELQEIDDFLSRNLKTV
jgi:hypothetical protein